MKRPGILLAALAITALAFFAAGCGGGGGGGERLSKHEFISKADGTCQKFEDKGKNLKPEGLPADFDPTSPNATDEQLDKFGDYLDDVTGLFRDEVDELRDLKPPEDFQSKYNTVLELLDEAGNEFGEATDAAHDGDKTKLKDKAQEASRHTDAADKIARDYGLKVCGSSD